MPVSHRDFTSPMLFDKEMLGLSEVEQFLTILSLTRLLNIICLQMKCCTSLKLEGLEVVLLYISNGNNEESIFGLAYILV